MPGAKKLVRSYTPFRLELKITIWVARYGFGVLIFQLSVIHSLEVHFIGGIQLLLTETQLRKLVHPTRLQPVVASNYWDVGQQLPMVLGY
jgi:hypothetical protein